MNRKLEFLGIGIALLAAAVIAVGVSSGVVAQNGTANESKIGISTNLTSAQSSLEAINDTTSTEYAENETGS
jgi:hypothetical protein